jgi:hypothetical protein
MGNIERWDVFICPSCGTLYPDLSTLCECELPNNIDGVETERVTVVPASQLRGAVSRDTLESDRFIDRVLDKLEERNGQPLNLARWDLKAAIRAALGGQS